MEEIVIRVVNNGPYIVRGKAKLADGNEMTHLQDFRVKLFEYGWKPSKARWAYWIVGFVFGFFSRLMGRGLYTTYGRLRLSTWW